MTAMGLAVALFQTGTPTNPDQSALTPGETYTCYVQLETATGLRWFEVVYTSILQLPDGTSSPGLWNVRAYAVDSGGEPDDADDVRPVLMRDPGIRGISDSGSQILE